MDPADYHVVYVDNRVHDDLDGKYIHKSRLGPKDGTGSPRHDSWEDQNLEYFELIVRQDEEVRNNLNTILSAFNAGTFCSCAVSNTASVLAKYMMPMLQDLTGVFSQCTCVRTEAHAWLSWQSSSQSKRIFSLLS